MTAIVLPPVVRAVCALVENRCAVLAHRETPWASATFAGARHEIELQFLGGEAIAMGEALIDGLGEAEISLAGKMVVSAAVLWSERRMRAEPSLTVKLELLVLDNG